VVEIPIRLLPPPPRLDASGFRLNAGEKQQRVTFAGTGLDRIEKLDSDAADIALDSASEEGTRRGATIRLHTGAKAGDRLAVGARVEGMAAAVRFPALLQIAPPRPRIVEAKPSVASDLVVAARDDEIPAGSWVNYALRVDAPSGGSALTLACAEPERIVQPLKLHLGEKLTNAQLAAVGEGAWFLSVDAAAVGQSGCALTAVVETEEAGKSDAFTLGRVVRLPRIESLAMTNEKAPEGFYGILKGFDLEMIEKTGWDGAAGIPVAELPKPVAGAGSNQTLRIVMPWPSPAPKSPLFVWLRGDTEARATRVQP